MGPVTLGGRCAGEKILHSQKPPHSWGQGELWNLKGELLNEIWSKYSLWQEYMYLREQTLEYVCM